VWRGRVASEDFFLFLNKNRAERARCAASLTERMQTTHDRADSATIESRSSSALDGGNAVKCWPNVDELLAEDADLRKSYQILTGNKAPTAWCSPDWANIDCGRFIAVVYGDFVNAFEALGLDLEYPYDVFYRGGTGGYFKDFRPYRQHVLELIGRAVQFRVVRHRTKRPPAGVER
jgi:hypothetical protein